MKMEKFYGLSFEEAKKRLEIYGRNEIKEEKKLTAWKILMNQFKSPLILLMLFAATLSFILSYLKGESLLDSLMIIIVILIAALSGFLQEYKAEKTIESLKKLSMPKTKVIREGNVVEIETIEVVPEDLVLLEGGDIVPADAEIIDGFLEVDESPLTGESRAVKKKRGENVFSGCHVLVGKAIAKVYATGMKTEIGKIAEKMQEMREEETTFQRELNRLSKSIVKIILAIIFISFIFSYRKFGLVEAIFVSLALAVAAIPEGLPAVITISLSVAARNMAKVNALVRKLAITETIGSVDVICTDKTGTITEGKMKVKDIWTLEDTEFSREIAIEICYYCNDAKFSRVGNEEKLIGDETDIALKEYSSKFIKEEKYVRLDEIHFTSERKMMSVLCSYNDKKLVFSKGAPEIILLKCSKVLKGNNVVELNEELRKNILEKNKELASQAYRVLALAYKEGELEEKDLIFVGLVFLYDPPRKEVKEAIEECYSAGIRVIMITGDNEITALSIAREVGLKTEGFVRGEDLDRMSEEEISNLLDRGINVFARTNPFHKLKILEVLKKKGYVVAMTGDGVNDALALKKADVGIAMGIKGTEVAKEASDIVLLDDNFATIKNAIKEGRRTFDNIRRFILFLFGTAVAEVFIIMSSIILLPFMLLYPIQILWINLVTSGPPAIAISFDPAEPNVMKKRPRNKSEGILSKKLILKIVAIGTTLGLSIFLAGLFSSQNVDIMRTVVFTSFVLFEMIVIAAIRFSENMIGLKYWLENKFLVISLIIVIVLQFILIYSPIAHHFKSTPLTFSDIDVLFLTSILCFVLCSVSLKYVEKILKKENEYTNQPNANQ